MNLPTTFYVFFSELTLKVQNKLQPAREYLCSHRKQFISFIFLSVPLGITLAILHDKILQILRDPTEPEKEIKHLVSAANGKNVSGKDCMYLCKISSSEITLDILKAQATSLDKSILELYTLCYEKKHQSLAKLNEIRNLRLDFFKINTYAAASRLPDYIPKLDDFDREFYPNECLQAQNFVNNIHFKQNEAFEIIQETSNELKNLCKISNDNLCSNVQNLFESYRKNFNKIFDDPEPTVFFDEIIDNCLTKCKQLNMLASNSHGKNSKILSPEASDSHKISSNESYLLSPIDQNKNTLSSDRIDDGKKFSNKTVDNPHLRIFTVRKNVDITKTPNRFGDVILQMHGGEAVTVLKEPIPGWSFVTYDGKNGYLPNNVLMENGQ